MNDQLVPQGTVEIMPPSRTGVLARVVANARRRYEYLGKNGEENVGIAIQTFALIIGAGLVFWNIDAIKHVVDTTVATGTALVKGGILAAVLWVMWQIISSQRLRYTVAQMIDQTVEKIHMWWIDRDKFGAAKYGIRRLYERIEVAQQAKGVINGVLEKEDAAIDEHKRAAQEAARSAQGFDAELERRKTNPSGRPVSSSVGGMTVQQVENMLALKKATLRSHYEFYQGEIKDRARLDQDSRKIDIMISAATAKIGKLETDLQIAQQRWELNREKMLAGQAARDVVSGPEFQDLQHALTGIKNEAFEFDGQFRRYMDELDPTVRTFQTDQAASDIADEEFYHSFANDLGLDEADVKTRLLPAATETNLPEIDEILGGSSQKQAVPIAAGRRSNVDDLLKRRSSH